ncbi:GPP34 family phosphoprotein [Nocardia sp. BSTN01]|uniref:GPP34 family phosphoprotein n=1 Tax=Nocardia sp. BSTN01 TaxID=2783665 RepID=UPI00188F2171|nr:GPP34 family phosphoprotein [Nocardia sp. BSTN01]MBF4996956.1 GPP34 family phosphoprotein [Nocardia sp. BSTN01]
MTPIAHDLLWLLLDDDTGRLVIDRHTTGLALTVAAFADNSSGAGHHRPTAPPQRLRRRSLDALHATHRVRPRRTRFGGVISRTAWPTTDLLGKQELRRSLQRALFDAQPADDATRALIAVLHGVDALAIQCPRWSPRETDYWARRFIAQHADCADIAESLAHVEREALAESLSFGARAVFANQPLRSATGTSAQRTSTPTLE